MLNSIPGSRLSRLCSVALLTLVGASSLTYGSSPSDPFSLSITSEPQTVVQGARAKIKARARLDYSKGQGTQFGADLFYQGAIKQTLGPKNLRVGESFDFELSTERLLNTQQGANSVVLEVLKYASDGNPKQSYGKLLFDIKVERDLIAPQVQAFYPSAQDRYVRDPGVLSAIVADSFGYIESVSVVIDGMDQTSSFTQSVSSDEKSVSISGSLGFLSEGQHTITVSGKDYGGNQAALVTRTLIIDKTAPSIATSTKDDVITNNPNFIVSAVVSDALSPVQSRLICNGVESYQSASPAWSATCQLRESLNFIEIQATDAAGNVAEPIRFTKVILDTIAPNANVQSPLAGSVIKSKTVQILATANELLKLAKANGVPLQISAADQKSVSGVIEFQDNGSKLIHFEFVDLAGNISNIDLPITIELYPALVISNIVPENGAAVGRTFLISGESNNELTSVQNLVNSQFLNLLQDKKSFSGSFTFPAQAPDGNYSGTLKAIDIYGQQVLITRNFRLDSSIPNPQPTEPPLTGPGLIEMANLQVGVGGQSVFTVSGDIRGLNFTETEPLLITMGYFQEELPASALIRQSSGVYKYIEVDKPRGIVEFTMDLNAFKYSMRLKGLWLDEYSNPQQVQINLGQFEKCEMAKFIETSEQWSFARTTSAIKPCVLTTKPLTSRKVVRIGETDQVEFKLDVPAQYRSSVTQLQVFRVNASLEPVGRALCTLSNNSNGQYACSAPVSGSSPSVVSFLVRGISNQFGQIISPKSSMSIIQTRYTPENIVRLNQTMDQISAIVAQAKFDESVSLEKKQSVVQAIRQLSFVKEARLTPDGFYLGILTQNDVSLSVSFAPSGSLGILDEHRYIQKNTAFIASMFDFGNPMGSAEGTFVNPDLGDNSKTLFQSHNSPSLCPKIDQTTAYLTKHIEGETGDLVSPITLRQMSSYGAIVIATHGGIGLNPRNEYDHHLATNIIERIPSKGFSESFKHVHLAGVDEDSWTFAILGDVGSPSETWYYAITPTFIRSLPNRLPNSLVIAAACESGETTKSNSLLEGRDDFKSAFLAAGAGAYLGFTKSISARFAHDISHRFLSRFVNDGTSVFQAFKSIQNDNIDMDQLRDAAGSPMPPSGGSAVIFGNQGLRYKPRLKIAPGAVLAFDYDKKKGNVFLNSLTSASNPLSTESSAVVNITTCGLEAGDSIPLVSSAPDWIVMNPAQVVGGRDNIISVSVDKAGLPDEVDYRIVRGSISLSEYPGVTDSSLIPVSLPVEVGAIDFEVKNPDNIEVYNLGAAAQFTSDEETPLSTLPQHTVQIVNKGTREIEVFSDFWITSAITTTACLLDPETHQPFSGCHLGSRVNQIIPARSEAELKLRVASLGSQVNPGGFSYNATGKYRGLSIVGRTAAPNEYAPGRSMHLRNGTGIFRNSFEAIESSFEILDQGKCPTQPFASVKPSLGTDSGTNVTFVTANQPMVFSERIYECRDNWSFSPDEQGSNSWSVFELIGASSKLIHSNTTNSSQAFGYSFPRPGVYTVKVDVSGTATMTNPSNGEVTRSPATISGHTVGITVIVVPEEAQVHPEPL